MKRVKTPKAEISLLDNYIVRMQIFDYIHLEEEDILEFNTIKIELTDGQAYKELFVSGKYTSLSKEARELLAKKEMGLNRIAKAIVVTSLAQRFIANFIRKFNKSKSKVKVFNSEEEAMQWFESIEG